MDENMDKRKNVFWPVVGIAVSLLGLFVVAPKFQKIIDGLDVYEEREKQIVLCLEDGLLGGKSFDAAIAENGLSMMETDNLVEECESNKIQAMVEGVNR